MKRLSLILIAALMIGCSNAEESEDGVGEGVSRASDKVPFEVEAKNGGVVTITSLENGLKILNVSINRGNCSVEWVGRRKGTEKLKFIFKSNKDGSSVTVVDTTDFRKDKEVEVLSVNDFYGKYGEDRAVEIDFGNKVTFASWFCNPIEAKIDTNKGAWTFSFR
jgi:lipoprotein